MAKIRHLDWLFFLSLFLVFLLPATDPDLGWHLRCGKEIWENRWLCQENRFSVLLPGYLWPNHHWLSQTILFLTYQNFGFWGLSFLNAFLMTATFFLFYLTVQNSSLERITGIILMVFLGWSVFSFGIRSQEWGFFFFSLMLFLCLKSKEYPKLVLFFPLVLWLWANTHGGSVILGLILLFLLFSPLPFFLCQPRKTLFLAAIYLLSALLTLINPFGLAIYQEAWRHFAGVDLSRLIAEWVPPHPFIRWLILLGGLLEALLIRTLLPLPFLFLTLNARRHLPFYFLVFFFSLLQNQRKTDFFDRLLKNRALKNALEFWLVFLFLLFDILFRLPLTLSANSSWENYSRNSNLHYPYRAVNFLTTQKPGIIFNRYEWGGFLIWRLPQFRVFVDGRMPAWPTPSGKSPYAIYLETLQTKPGWQETLRDYNIDWILISPGTFMDLLLRDNPEGFGWQEVYRDKISVVYKKI